MKIPQKNMQKLLHIMQQLRDPKEGCPWDIEQTFASLAPFTIEEAYEVVDAIEKNNPQHLQEELGDLLFQVVFYAQIAQEQKLFDFDSVVDGLNTKMIERHPHVFSENKQRLTFQQQSEVWEQAKLEKKANSKTSVLDDIPHNFPELLKSVKLTKRAAVIGFDWPSIKPVFNKMEEELQELKEAIAEGDKQHILDELGDVIFVCTNLARHLQIDPSLALRHANNKFETRFRAVEKQAKVNYPEQTFFDLEILDELWTDVKKLEK